MINMSYRHRAIIQSVLLLFTKHVYAYVHMGGVIKY